MIQNRNKYDTKETKDISRKEVDTKKQIGNKTNIYETMNNNKKLNENNNSKFYTKLPSLQM